MAEGERRDGLAAIEGAVRPAVAACRASLLAKPRRIRLLPKAFRKRCQSAPSGQAASQVRSMARSRYRKLSSP